MYMYDYWYMYDYYSPPAFAVVIQVTSRVADFTMCSFMMPSSHCNKQKTHT